MDTDSQTDKVTYKQRDSQIWNDTKYRHTDSQVLHTNTQTDRKRYTNRETERHELL